MLGESLKHLNATELALMRSDAALDVAVSQLGKADHPDIKIRRRFMAMANEVSEIRGDLKALLKKVREVRHAG